MDTMCVYMVVRSSLNMTAGKMVIQAAHGSEHLMDQYFKLLLIEAKLHSTTCEHQHLEDIRYWKAHGSSKIGLQACDEDWYALKEALGNEAFVIRDAGKTEVKPNTETVMIMWPVWKSKAHPIIQKLDLL